MAVNILQNVRLVNTKVFHTSKERKHVFTGYDSKNEEFSTVINSKTSKYLQTQKDCRHQKIMCDLPLYRRSDFLRSFSKRISEHPEKDDKATRIFVNF